MSEKACIIIPCYNESERLVVSTFLDFLTDHPPIDFCFVNDGSRDDTMSVLQQMQEQYPRRVILLENKQNQGKAETVRLGILHALAAGQYTYVGFLDADLATPVNEIPALIKVLEDDNNNLMSMGSRVKRLGTVIERKAVRHYLGRLFATVLSVLFHFNAYDTQCGAKVFKGSVAVQIFDRKFLSRWLFDVELLLRIRNLRIDYNAVIKEIPLNCWLEKGGSKIRFSHLIKMPFELYKIYHAYHRTTH